MKKGLNKKQSEICDRIAEAIYDEDHARTMYPKLNADVMMNGGNHDDFKLLVHIAEDEDRHWHDLFKIYNRLCK